MGFKDKVEENKDIIEKCKKVGAYNVGAARLYYCAFHEMKKFLEDHDFPYKEYLEKTGGSTGERDYSHGTIKEALYYFINGELGFEKGISYYTELQNFRIMYENRIKADYKTRQSVTKNEFDLSESGLNKIECVLAEVENGLSERG